MKRFLAIAAVAVLICASMAVGSEAQSVKIGYVDLQRVMLESEKGREAKKTLTDEMEKLKKTLSQRQDELQKMKDSLDKQSATITPEARSDKEKQYQSKLKDYQRLANDYQSELQQKDMEFTQKILKELEDIIKNVGANEKYTLIVEKSQGGVLFAAPGADVTDKVISTYNDQVKKRTAPATKK